MMIRPYQSSDLDVLKRITLEGFEGIAIDQNVETALGVLNGHDWRWRKARHVDEDVNANPAGGLPMLRPNSCNSGSQSPTAMPPFLTPPMAFADASQDFIKFSNDKE